jgi:hypothetical protein
VAWAPWRKSIAVRELTVDGADLTYLDRANTAAERRRGDEVARAIAGTKRAPEVRIDVAHAALRQSRLAYEDRTARPPYRLFLAEADVTVRGFSNARDARDGTAVVRGHFMGSGPAVVNARFNGARGPDFELDVEITNVDLRTMNDLLRAKGGFDVAGGRMSFFMEVGVRNGRIDGYAKPLFAGVDVYDRAQDAGKGPGRQLYEGIVGGLATLLENWQRDEVATRTDLSGPVESPQTSTREIVLRLLENAFLKAILPGLERSRGQRR